jgi:polysaccharide chain length determinant protein (PEP-CTERM system associated)
MLPGKKYTPADALPLLNRYKWYIIVPAVVCPFLALFVSSTLKNRYESSALIQVIPQRVPEAYVRASVTMRIEDRLTSILEVVRSRPRIEALINDFNLFPDVRRKLSMDTVVGWVNGSIDIEPIAGLGELGGGSTGRESFRVKVTYPDPVIAQKVCDRVAMMLVEQNQQERVEKSGELSEFLKSQLAESKRELEEQERRLEAFKLRYSGSLPSQLESNLQSLRGAQSSLQSIREMIARDRDQKLMWERMVRDLAADPLPIPRPDPSRTSDPNAPVVGLTARQRLDQAEATLTQLRQRLTAEHPDVIKQQRIVRELKPLADAEAAQAAASGGSSTQPRAGVTEAEVTRRDRIRERQAEIESLGRQIRSREAEEGRLVAQIRDLEGRIASSPGLESEFIKLNRDYTTKAEAYQSLLAKAEDAKVSKNLANNPTIGEQFRIIETPRVASQPSSPQRLMINVAGLAIGLAIGLGLVVLFELRDSSMRTESDVFSALSLPVLAQVPRIVTETEKQHRQRRYVMMSLARVAGAVVMTAAFVYFRLWNYVV